MELRAKANTLAGSEHVRRSVVGSAFRSLTLILAVLATGLVAGLYYAFVITVSPALVEQPDASFVATMNAINEKIYNPLFFFGFFGAALFPLVALAAHFRRPRSGRFWLIVLGGVLYIGGSFLPTMVVNVPMNDALSVVDPDAPARVLVRARNAFEDPWNFWNGVRTVFTTLSFVALVGSCLAREDRTRQEPSPGNAKKGLR